MSTKATSEKVNMKGVKKIVSTNDDISCNVNPVCKQGNWVHTSSPINYLYWPNYDMLCKYDHWVAVLVVIWGPERKRDTERRSSLTSLTFIDFVRSGILADSTLLPLHTWPGWATRHISKAQYQLDSNDKELVGLLGMTRSEMICSQPNILQVFAAYDSGLAQGTSVRISVTTIAREEVDLVTKQLYMDIEHISRHNTILKHS